ncbi:putative DNA polymerase sliding clamp 2 [Paramecium bursaria Chlorella virus AN69C]|uniref:Putative DNA polymerase sliding clamp 2 n=1 Tax=Paramecium bursaria Chlorella virus IL3A TaxID=46019 RepID=M1HVR6_PBCVI|nr:putative DNA polymerase sliding clamp 2 [Paramecium bursaria Chlorella virus AN69C]AGE51447.1 putative DNA polymerase sliding clamp 2 [Paramecium bursaria Chlorella virus CviKI]AGE52462.1 putative DNA polymerase sliding clamp 2 [Paramecium bursaria Chlorella virus CvsA1]AGE53816.1 putative DNA polymerase sliding clamp 2 [Paramecium bursaria Chlorella virus IL3A]AGE55231.1 putative DNA polymerase sliding clamp 2 [Paramecium bursaria Chlorella virus MA1E]AGE57247.1 putative DNA polymerase sli
MDDDNVLFHIRTLQGNVIKSLFDCLKEILHDVMLSFGPTGIRISALDGAKVSLVHLKLDSESFEEYKCEHTYELGVNVLNMFKLLRSAGSHDSILFRYLKNDPHMIELTIQNFEKNSLTKFNMKLIEIDSVEIEVGDIEFDTIIVMPANYFQRICRDMSDITDHLVIVKKGDEVSFNSDYTCVTDFASQKTIIGDSDNGQITCNNDTDYESKFSLKYLTSFCKASGMSSAVEIYLKESYPLILKYTVGSMGALKFVIAPVLS